MQSNPNGFGLFETFRVRFGKARCLAQHLTRILNGSLKFGAPLPSHEDLRTKIRATINHQQDLVVRLNHIKRNQTWQGSDDWVWEVWSRPFSTPKANLKVVLDDSRLGVSDPFRLLKSCSRIHYEWGLGKAKAMGYDDALFLDNQDFLIETAIGNTIVKIKDRLLTPPLSRCPLPGVARAWLLEQGVIEEADIHLSQLSEATWLARINSVQGLQVIVDFGDFGRGLHLTKQAPIDPEWPPWLSL